MLGRLSSALGIGGNKAKVILDTNFLLLPGSKRIDIYTEIYHLVDEPHEICVLAATYDELLRITKGETHTKTRGADKLNAKLGFVMAKQKGLKTLHSSSKDVKVDDELVRIADQTTYVATLDRNLQKRLKEKGVHIITVRQNRLILKP